MSKNRKRKAAAAKAKTQRLLRANSREHVAAAALGHACWLCNAPAGERCSPMRDDDTAVLRGSVHYRRGRPAGAAAADTHSGPPVPPLSLEMHYRLDMDVAPSREHGQPGDPRAEWDETEGVNALAAAAIAAAEVCEACMNFYLPALDENEYEHVVPWIWEIASRVHAGQDPLPVSHRARAWHRTRHLLDAATGGFRGPGVPGFTPAASFTTLGPEDVQAHYGVETWQFMCAAQAGILPPWTDTAEGPRWLAVLINHDRGNPQFISNCFGTRTPLDAAETATYLTNRWGVPVGRADVEGLVALGHLDPIGVLEGEPVYMPDHVDRLGPGMRYIDADTRRERFERTEPPVIDAAVLQQEIRDSMRSRGVASDAPSSITVACPRCGAEEGERCVAASGKQASSQHVDRIRTRE
jgi:hypothetical protein